MAAVTRRQYKGAAASTTILAGISLSSPTCELAANTGWPSSSGVPFYVVIDPGTSTEEKCSATISGTTLTLTRGQDDTTAVAHSANAVIYPVFSADEADEANLFASTMTTRGDLLTMGSGPTVARLPIGSNSGYVLKTDGTDPSWGQVAAAGIASDAVTTVKILDSAVTTAKIANDTIVNADINSAAAIAYSKLNLATSIVNADVSTSAAIALSKLATTGTVTATTFVGALTGDVTGTASNASKIGNRTVFVQSATPTALATNDIWFQTA
jgi:hypothetical protein